MPPPRLQPQSRSRSKCSGFRDRANAKRRRDSEHDHDHRSSNSDSDSDNEDDGPTTGSKKSAASGSGSRIKRLATPIQSEMDDNEYRLIELSNGLRFLLIRDPQSKVDEASTSPSSSKLGYNSKRDAFRPRESGREGHQFPILKPKIFSMPTRMRRESLFPFPTMKGTPWTSAHWKIKHGQTGEILPQKKSKKSKCSVAMSVNVGSQDDPQEFQGLAHLCEHLVHYGSESFPEGQAYITSITNLNGDFNAYTSFDRTNYHFSILEDEIGLAHVLNIFSAMLRVPLFLQDSIRRETEAVDNEFYLQRTHLGVRLLHLVNRSTVKSPTHPVKNFSCGNKKSLLHTDTDSDDNTNSKSLEKLQCALKAFHRENYYAGNMGLVVKTGMEMQAMEKLVGTLFEKMRAKPFEQRPIPYTIPSGRMNPYNNENFRRSLTIKSCEDFSGLFLGWSLPTGTSASNYHTKPMDYIATLINVGPLKSYLLRHNLVLQFSAEGDGSLSYQNKYAKLITIQIILTQKGCAQIQEVLLAVFSYLTLLREQGNDPTLYAGAQKVERFNFDYNFKQDQVEELADTFHLVGHQDQDILYANRRFFNYNEKLIGDCLNELQPARAFFCLATNQFRAGTQFERDELFGVEYFLAPVDRSLIEALEDVEIYDEFELPNLGNWIPALKNASPARAICPNKAEDEAELNKPQILIDMPQFRLVFVPVLNLTFPEALDEAYYDFYIPINLLMEHASVKIMATLLLTMIQSSLSQDPRFNKWTTLGLNVSAADLIPNPSVGIHYSKLNLGLIGPNYLLKDVMSAILGHLSTFEASMTEEQFNTHRISAAQGIINANLEYPMYLAYYLVVRLKYDGLTTDLEDRQYLQQTNYSEFKRFVGRVFQSMGQITLEISSSSSVDEILSFGLTVKDHKFVKCRKLATMDDPDPGHNNEVNKPVTFPLGEHCLRVRSLNPDTQVSCVTNYYQLSKRSHMIDRVVKLIVRSIQSPVFQELRVVQQLGYAVYCQLHMHKEELGFSVTVVHHADKHCPCTVDQRIDSFLQMYYGRLLETKELGIRFLRGSGINKSRDYIEAYFAKYFLLNHPTSAVRKISVQVLAHSGKVQDVCCKCKEGKGKGIMAVKPTCRLSTWSKKDAVPVAWNSSIPGLTVAEDAETNAESDVNNNGIDRSQYFITNLDKFYKTCK